MVQRAPSKTDFLYRANIIKKLFYILLAVLIFSNALDAKQKFNPMTGKFETTSPDSKLKYNYIEKEWKYAPPNSELKYDYLNKRYEMAPKNYTNKYNYIENKWEMTDPKSKLQRNPYNNKFEFVSPYSSEIDPYKSDIEWNFLKKRGTRLWDF